MRLTALHNPCALWALRMACCMPTLGSVDAAIEAFPDMPSLQNCERFRLQLIDQLIKEADRSGDGQIGNTGRCLVDLAIEVHRLPWRRIRRLSEAVHGALSGATQCRASESSPRVVSERRQACPRRSPRSSARQKCGVLVFGRVIVNVRCICHQANIIIAESARASGGAHARAKPLGLGRSRCPAPKLHLRLH